MPDAITVNVHNLCAEPMRYVVEGSEDESEQSIAPGSVVQLQMGPDEKIASADGSLAAWVHTDGAHIWFDSSCRGVGTSEDPDADPAQLDDEFAQARAETFALSSVRTSELTSTELADALAELVGQHLREGEVVPYATFKTTIDEVKALYVEHGYPHVNVIPKTAEDGDATTLAVEIVVQPGARSP